jgi:transcription elongation factor GreA
LITTSAGTLAPMEPAQLSTTAHERLVAELEHRTGALRFEIADRIERARELGDLKENADYDAAKNEQGLNEARVRQLEAMLRDAVIVEGPPGDVVEAGVIVEIRITGDDETQSYLIGSIEERNDTYEVLSTSSVLGQALVGRRAGETTTYETPRKVQLEVEIVTIRPLG